MSFTTEEQRELELEMDDVLLNLYLKEKADKIKDEVLEGLNGWDNNN